MNVRTAFGIVAALLLLAFYAWVVDFVTLEGERTVYTVACSGGDWANQRCSGSLVAADRYRFRALKAHREVLFWTVGSAEPAGKLTDCDIENNRNWICKPGADAARAITLQLARGRPVVDGRPSSKELHFVPKLRWLLLRIGISWGSSVDA